MTDIVERLRDTITMLAVTPMNLSLEDWDRHANAMQDAAFEINRLRAENEVLRAVNDALSEQMKTMINNASTVAALKDENDKLRAALEEAIEYADQDYLTPAGEAMVNRWRALVKRESDEG